MIKKKTLIEEFNKFESEIKQMSTLQKMRLDILKWLVDDISSIAQGRTHLLAISFIKIAFKYPGRKTMVWDHHHSHSSNENMTKQIYRILKSYPKILSKFTFYSDAVLWKGEKI